jgi:hypothetical protein
LGEEHNFLRNVIQRSKRNIDLQYVQKFYSFINKKRSCLKNIHYMYMWEIITWFSTEANFKLCPYITKIILSHNSKSTAYRVQVVLSGNPFSCLYNLHCPAHGVSDPFPSFSIGNLGVNKSPRLYAIRFHILDARKSQPI